MLPAIPTIADWRANSIGTRVRPSSIGVTRIMHGEGDAETKFSVDGIGWHRTGDLGYIDSKGRLWLLGQCSAKICDSRGIVYPFAIESAAMDHPSVKRAGLV